MNKGRKRQRGTTMGEMVRDMSNKAGETSIEGTFVKSNQAQANVILPNQARSTSQNLSQLHREFQPTSSKQLPKKKGRGPSKLPDAWDSGVKIQVTLNEYGQVIGEKTQYNKYCTALGALARVGSLLPLNYASWSYMPKDKLDNVWNEVQANTTLPPEAKTIVLNTINGMWKDWKRRLKADYFTPYKYDCDFDLSQLPNEQVELDQWLDLVKHWKLEEVEKKAKNNAGYRANRKHPHRTGKTPFQLVREEMKKNGNDVTKLDIFMESRSRGKGIDADKETSDLVREIQEELLKKADSELTKEFKDDLFINVFGEEQRGHVRCTGRVIIQSKPHVTSLLKDQTSEITSQIKELCQLKEELMDERKNIENIILKLDNEKAMLAKQKEGMETEICQQYRQEFDHMKVSMDFLVSLIHPSAFQAALSRVPPQDIQMISDALHGTFGSQLDSDENTPRVQQPSEQFSILSKPRELVDDNDLFDPRSIMVGRDVLLYCSNIPKIIVAEGVLLSLDPNDKIDNEPLGHEFVKVVIRKAVKSDYLLVRPRSDIKTVQQAIDKIVAWEFIDVMEK